jgi:predicted nuclease of predicted toxin-antitoxin system
MRILLDENLDWRLGRYLADHQVKSVPLLGGLEYSPFDRTTDDKTTDYKTA